MGRTWKEALDWRSDESKDKRRLRLSMKAVAGAEVTPLEQPEIPIKTVSKEKRVAVRLQMAATKEKIWFDRQPNKEIIYSVIQALEIKI